MHHHHDASRKLLIATLGTAAFVVVELIAGIAANSLALVGDAVHNFTDTLALLLAFVAVRIERRPANATKTYGYHRAGVLAAFINSGTLVAFTLYLFYEAVQRLRVPHPVDTRTMLIVAVVAFVLNAAISWWLHDEGREDLNVRGAVLHMLGDAASSVGIVIAALLIARTGRPFWDPAMSIVIGVLILWSSFGVLREAVNLLLEGTPPGIDPDEVTRAIAAVDGILGVHHLHIWALGASRRALSAHLIVGDVPLKTTGQLLAHVNDLLQRDYAIEHTTIQFELAECPEEDPYCLPIAREP
ncbi:MAG TPA: cation diffusion facilitator family transporter, partial [Thermoanaerobaculia bacterium]|nr:cation diffusion facilitator family transporter [Thermoanaerobaculia bacterium]